MLLSIAVLTMNRANQVIEAIKSCLACDLPNDTEFVILDNASTDNTEVAIKDLFKSCNFKFNYYKSDVNLGVGGGRNKLFEISIGKYFYVLDDDAVVDFESNPDFFTKAIDIFENNQKIVTLTTQIYDTAWEKNRVEIEGTEITLGVYKCLMFRGGSHFLRKSFFEEQPYLSNKYGYEEIPPSLRVINSGKINAFCPELLIIHKPVANKWNYNDENNHALLVKGIALPFAIKKMMYPVVFYPLISLAHMRRIKNYMSHVPDAKKKVEESANEFMAEYSINEKVKFSTVLRMFFDFKLSIF